MRTADAEGTENLPRQGVRWRRTDEGWERWSFMDEAWVDDRTPRPPDLPDEVAIGAVVTQDETGDWTDVVDPAATAEWPD